MAHLKIYIFIHAFGSQVVYVSLLFVRK